MTTRKNEENGEAVRRQKTSGGLQLWTDWRWASGWRLQKFYRRADRTTERGRILDNENRQVFASGFEECNSRFSELLKSGRINRPNGEAVILLHGLNRTRNSLQKLEREILRRTDLTPIRLSFASSRNTVENHAVAIGHLLRDLCLDESGIVTGPIKLHFVCHSMGNIVVRRILNELEAESVLGQADKSRNKRSSISEHLGRMVMLAPPNQGSVMARWLKYSLIFNLIAGRGGREFSTHWQDVEKNLATPFFEFGVIAGAQQKYRWINNPFFTGTDDWTVATAETKLAGETDRFEGGFFHGTIMTQKVVIDATIRFLQTGRFQD